MCMKVMTNSLLVAEKFERRHADVIKTIESLTLANEKVRSLYESATYIVKRYIIKKQICVFMEKLFGSLKKFCIFVMQTYREKSLIFFKGFNLYRLPLSWRAERLYRFLRYVCNSITGALFFHFKINFR